MAIPTPGFVVARGYIHANTDFTLFSSSQYNLTSVTSSATGLYRINIVGGTGLVAGKFVFNCQTISPLNDTNNVYFNQINLDSSTTDTGSGNYVDFQVRRATSGTAEDQDFNFVIYQSDSTDTPSDNYYDTTWWVYCTLSDSPTWPTIQESYHVNSITDYGTGGYIGINRPIHPTGGTTSTDTTIDEGTFREGRTTLMQAYLGGGYQQYYNLLYLFFTGETRYRFQTSSSGTSLDPEHMRLVIY